MESGIRRISRSGANRKRGREATVSDATRATDAARPRAAPRRSEPVGGLRKAYRAERRRADSPIPSIRRTVGGRLEKRSRANPASPMPARTRPLFRPRANRQLSAPRPARSEIARKVQQSDLAGYRSRSRAGIDRIHEPGAPAEAQTAPASATAASRRAR